MDITFTIGNAIPLTFEDGNLLPKSEIYAYLVQSISKYIDLYEGDSVHKLTIRVYTEAKKREIRILSQDERKTELLEFLETFESIKSIDPISTKKIRHRNKKYPTYIPSRQSKSKNRKPILVADTETIPVDKDKVHVPYAAGVMVVFPTDNLSELRIDTYFSEDYSPHLFDSFEKNDN